MHCVILISVNLKSEKESVYRTSLKPDFYRICLYNYSVQYKHIFDSHAPGGNCCSKKMVPWKLDQCPVCGPARVWPVLSGMHLVGFNLCLCPQVYPDVEVAGP